GTAARDTGSDVAADLHTVAVAGRITGDGAVAAVGQVAADIDAATVSTVTVHGGVGQGTVTADVHTGTVTGGAAGDDTVSDIATDVHTVTVAGGITGDGAAGNIYSPCNTDPGAVRVAVHRRINYICPLINNNAGPGIRCTINRNAVDIG